MNYSEKFINTCFEFEEAEKLMAVFGAALYHDKAIMGRVIAICGKAGTGKSSILWPFKEFSRDKNIWVIDDFDLKKLSTFRFNEIACELSEREVLFVSTNRLPDDELPDYLTIIKTSGNRLSFEDWEKFKWEMHYFPDDFFKKCMNYWRFNKELFSDVKWLN